jgi:hypothetical protein
VEGDGGLPDDIAPVATTVAGQAATPFGCLPCPWCGRAQAAVNATFSRGGMTRAALASAGCPAPCVPTRPLQESLFTQLSFASRVKVREAAVAGKWQAAVAPKEQRLAWLATRDAVVQAALAGAPSRYRRRKYSL